MKRQIIPPTSQPRKRKFFFWGLGKIALGLVAIAGSVHLFLRFTNLEAEGGSTRLSLFLSLLYKIGGKWTCCGIGLAGGIFFLYEGYRQMRQPGRSW